jgi:hypothetical protein
VKGSESRDFLQASRPWSASADDDAMSDGGSDISDDSSTGGSEPRIEDGAVIVHLDNVLEFTMDVLLQRSRAVDERIKALFKEGDTNDDGRYGFATMNNRRVAWSRPFLTGTLSFQEFRTLVHKLQPNLSDHSISKLYRDAFASSDSYGMRPDSFAAVCKKFGLVRLLDLEKAEGFLATSPGG